MAELSIFHYHPRRGPIHRIDGRVKLLLIISLVVSIFSTAVYGLVVLTVLLISSATLVPLRPKTFLRETIFFFVLAAVIFFTRPGVEAGAVAAWRFLLVVLTGMIFTATASPSEIHAVLYTIAAPLPGIPQGRIAEHVSLTILFIPILFDAAKEIGEARKARLIEKNSNPIRRLSSLAGPLLEVMVGRIEETAYALESRCFDENAVRFELEGTRKDLFIALLAPPAAAALIIFC